MRARKSCNFLFFPIHATRRQIMFFSCMRAGICTPACSLQYKVGIRMTILPFYVLLGEGRCLHLSSQTHEPIYSFLHHRSRQPGSKKGCISNQGTDPATQSVAWEV